MNTMKYYGAAKYNRNSNFNRTGAGKYSRLSGQSTLTSEELRAMLEKNIADKEAFKKAAERKATKSKVCIIANRLIKQGVNRSEAFRRAWTIVKAAKIETKVSGVTFGSRQKALERLTHYETDKISIRLEREAANEYDSNAIQVIATVTDKGSYTVGYINKQLAAIIAPLIDCGKAVKATFQEIRGKYKSYHNLGMEVSLSI